MDALQWIDLISEAWASWMWYRVIDSSILFLMVSGIWLLIRPKAPPHVGYLLFSIVLVKLIVPWEISIPALLTSHAPHMNIGRSLQALDIDRWTGLKSGGIESNGVAKQIEDTEQSKINPRQNHPDILSPPLSRAAVQPPLPITTKGMVFLFWSGIVCILTGLFIRAEWRMRRRFQQASRIDPANYAIDLTALQKISRVWHSIRWLSSGSIRTPITFGYAHPSIVLPSDMLGNFTPHQIRWILLHELAHFRRRDHWVYFIQKILSIGFFFHPAVWYTNGMMNQLREYACDDEALLRSEIDRDVCGEGFLSLIREANKPVAHLTAPLALMNYKTHMRRRMMRILDEKRKLRMGIPASLVLLVLITLILILPTVRASEDNNQSVNSTEQSVDLQGDIEDASQNVLDVNSTIARSIQFPKQISNIDSFSLSPNGQKVAYLPPWEYKDIDVLDLRSDKTVRITEHFLEQDSWKINSSPVWRSDNTQIAFSANHNNTNCICIIDASGQEYKTIYKSTDLGLKIQDWSENGKWLLAITTSKDQTQNFIKIPTNDGKSTKILPHGYPMIDDGSISPEGNFVTYSREHNGGREIFLYNSALQEEFQITKPPHTNIFPLLTDDGKFLVFKSNRLGSWKFWTQPIRDGVPSSAPFVIKNDVSRNTLLIQTLDKRKLLYGTWYPPYGIYSVKFNPETGIPTSKPSLLNVGSRNGAISPNGTLIAFNSFDYCIGFRGFGLHLMSDQGEYLKSIKTNINNPIGLGWFPDGRCILANGFDENWKKGLFRIDIESEEVEFIHKTVSDGCLSPDGQKIAFAMPAERSNNPAMAIYIVKPEIGATPQLLRHEPSEDSRYPTWSPDGNYIVFTSHHKETSIQRIFVISVQLGGEVKELARFNTEKKSYLSYPAWSPNGKYIAFSFMIKENDGYPSGIWMINSGGGEPFQLPASGDMAAKDLNWSPSGNTLYYSGNNVSISGEDNKYWILENYLPSEKIEE